MLPDTNFTNLHELRLRAGEAAVEGACMSC
jgi:hypothetical protein